MIFCIPTNDDRGISASLSSHFGKAPWFTIVDSVTGSVEHVRNEEGGRVHGACAPLDEILGRGVEGILCRGIGRGASSRLAAAGIAVFLTDQPSAAAGLDAWRAGTVRRLDGGAGACSDDHHGSC